MAKVILTVDDSPSIRQMVTFTLKSAGYEVVDAPDAPTALSRARARQFDMILTDINMPGMDGFATSAALRALPEYASVPILVLTTESSDEMKQKGRASGATGWLVKPFDPQKLISLVKRVIG